MSTYRIIIEKAGGGTFYGDYGDEFFNLEDRDIVMNLLGMKKIADDEVGEMFDEVLPPDPEALDPEVLGHEIDMEVLPPEGSPDHPQYLNDEEREENREAIKNL